MPAERLYFDDSYIQTFTARVTRRTTYNGQPAVALDRSAFYPEGGGQPGDRGILNEVPVLDTQADDDGEVWHLLAAPLDSEQVEGRIDWARRFDLMQQHHGQHLLSAACEQHFDARTMAVHLGTETCTVDLDYPGFSAEQIAAIEEETNRMIWANVPIEARFVTPDELGRLSLRKPPQAYERIRIVSAGDFDHSACGGTHPRQTGEVGSVMIRRWERYKNGTRVEFICGGRAIRDYRWKTRVLLDLAADLSVGLPELPAAVERLRAAEATQRKALERAQERLLDYDAQSLIAAAETIGGVPVVVQAYADQTLDALRGLGRRIVDAGGVALLGLRADKAQLVFSRPPQVDADMGALLRAAASVVGGRGGGRPEAAQGGGPDVERLDEALQIALAQIRQSLGG
ncbi:MAG TPA: DHHA1 domain-containing protein [Herpetosiphonaceae bacterium]